IPTPSGHHMRHLLQPLLVCIGSLYLLAGTSQADEKEVPLEFTGGHDIGKGDFGRPPTVIPAPLGGKTDEIRQAFHGVTPAKGGPPSGEEARKNKEALMKVLGPLGVTNDRLDEVSNHYRYQPQKGELWPTTPAKGHAIVEDGKVKKIIITKPGAGY